MSILNSNLVAAIVGGCFSLVAVAVTIYYQEANEPEVTKNELRTCWESVIDIGNVLSFCFRSGDEVSGRTVFPNQRNESSPTICQSKGSFQVKHSKYFLTFKKGSCDNGRGIQGVVLECVASTPNTLKCISEKNGERYSSLYLRI